MSITDQCTEDCERQPTCTICGRRKKPWGRDSRTNDGCTSECEGYMRDPKPGHLWPGELARIRAEESQ